jgi:hypothetical protein
LKPRVIVLTDISNEPDDEESLVRFLVYSNEFDVEALIATSSVWLRDKTRPEIIHGHIDAYAQVRDNLLLHAPGFPTADRLRSITKAGLAQFGMIGVGPGKSSEGSRWIIEVVDRLDPRPVWILVWGGANCLAQALWDVRQTRSIPDIEKFVARLRVYTISDQDDSGAWLRHTFPRLQYIVSPSTVDSKEYYLATWTGISGDRHYANGPMEDFHLVDNPWLEENIIRGHGPLGARYPKVAYIMEGDTPSFLNLIPNGLAADLSPAYGGWGGRYELRQSYGESRPIWTNSRDTVVTKDGRSHTSNAATIWRWRAHFQYDFAARMDWCVQPRSKANHPPEVTVNGQAGKDPISINARPGEEIRLSASSSDQLAYRWLPYREAGTSTEGIIIADPAFPEISVTAPKSGTAHIILQATNSGVPPLTSYRRVILQTGPATPA